MILILIFAEVLGKSPVLTKHLALYANLCSRPRSLRFDRRSSHELSLESFVLNGSPRCTRPADRQPIRGPGQMGLTAAFRHVSSVVDLLANCTFHPSCFQDSDTGARKGHFGYDKFVWEGVSLFNQLWYVDWGSSRTGWSGVGRYWTGLSCMIVRWICTLYWSRLTRD